MRPESIRRIQDAMAKLAAKNKLVHGGTQYSPDVSQLVAGINRGHATMRNQKPKGDEIRPLPLRELQARSRK